MSLHMQLYMKRKHIIVLMVNLALSFQKLGLNLDQA